MAIYIDLYDGTIGFPPEHIHFDGAGARLRCGGKEKKVTHCEEKEATSCNGCETEDLLCGMG